MDTDRDKVVLDAAVAVADQVPVAWEDLERRDPAASGPLANLRLLAAVADAHRTAQGSDSVTGREALFRWGHLEVLEKLGEGSFGEVFRAHDPVLDRPVALKLLHPGARVRGGGDLLTEARHLARIRHPNVVVAHGADRHDGRVGLWTDLVEGETLEQYLAREGVLQAEETARIGLELARALAAIHGAGLLHGDVKPANIMRERGGRIVLMDFGAVADAPRGVANEAVVCGTPLVMAPELFSGGDPTPRSDIYSLGVVLYRLLTGRFPVEAADLHQLARRHAVEGGVPLGDARPEVPSGLVQVVERALAPDPCDRYVSAGALERDLARWLSGQEPGSRLAQGFHFRGRYRRWLGSAAVVLVLGVAGSVAWRTWWFPPLTVPVSVRSLAVLPFQSLDGGREEAGVGLGLADAVINRLSQVQEVRVSPTSAVLPYAGSRPETSEVARTLGVDAVLDGRIQRSGERVRVTVQLLAARDGAPLWADVFDQRGGDVFALQDAIAERLAAALRVRLTNGIAAPVPAGDTASPDARTALLMGRHFLGRRTVAALERAVAELTRAIELDPGFALAWAGLAEAEATLPGLESAIVPPGRGYVAARTAAERAAILDGDLAAAHRVLGLVHLRHDWDWAAAERELDRALALDPGCAMAHLARAEFLTTMGRHGEAVNAAGRAVDLEPLSLVVLTGASASYLEAGWLDDAARLAHRAMELDPSFHPAYTAMAGVYERRDMPAAAVAQWQNAMALSGWTQGEVASLGRAFSEGGLRGAWRWRLHHLQADARIRPVSPALLARAHAAVGERVAALQHLEEAARVRDEFLLRVRRDPAFEDLRADPRFLALQERLALLPGTYPAGTGTHDTLAREQAGTLRVTATLFRDRGGLTEPLAGGATVQPGDRLYCTVSSTEPLFVYVLNEDQTGRAFTLFPLPGFDLGNPLTGGEDHRLPGRRDGMVQDWVVTSSGGRDVVLVVGARERLPALEREMATWDQASAGRAVERQAPGGSALRGIGGLAFRSAPGTPGGRLSAIAAGLVGLESRGEVWIQEFVLTSVPSSAGAARD